LFTHAKKALEQKVRVYFAITGDIKRQAAGAVQGG
jgi:hypothetical protein